MVVRSATGLGHRRSEVWSWSNSGHVEEAAPTARCSHNETFKSDEQHVSGRGKIERGEACTSSRFGSYLRRWVTWASGRLPVLVVPCWVGEYVQFSPFGYSADHQALLLEAIKTGFGIARGPSYNRPLKIRQPCRAENSCFNEVPRVPIQTRLSHMGPVGLRACPSKHTSANVKTRLII